MTETNINALCSVEAVFDGIDIEVTVEFSAGGGTFEHDELTAESRAKANQHPIPSITGLQSALDGKANSSHVHNISDVTGLQSALDGKSSVVEHNDLTGRDAADVHPKESITGLKISDSPEFADTQITPLADEATYSASVWTYLVGLFTTVPKSVKSHIVKIWERLQFIEDNVVLDLITTQALTSLTITQDKNGNALNLVDFDIYVTAENVDNVNNALLTFNNNSSLICYNGVTRALGVSFFVYITGFINTRAIGFLSFRKLNGNYVFNQLTNDTSLANAQRNSNYGGYIISDIGNVTRIDFTLINWKSGTRIKIIRR